MSEPLIAEPLPRPSWAREGWPLPPAHEWLTALDPGFPDPAQAAAAVARAAPAQAAHAEESARDTIRAVMLIRTYRVRGHLAARLDPLGLADRPLPPDLTPEYHGLTDPDRVVFIGGVFAGIETITVRELVDVLQRNYCGHVGLEYMHITDVEERRFLQEKFEGREAEIHFTPEGKRAILNKLIEAEQFEKFLARKYVGTKRFGLEGGEAAIPALESIIKVGGARGVKEMVIGMAHRGRLNVLANVMQKPFQAIFHEFSGGSAHDEDVGGSGDVKYHLGTSTDRTFDGNTVHLSLTPNPSHLEAVDPVVLGKARAVQDIRGRPRAEVEDEVMPVLLHGDAAFAGQGIVAECFALSGVPGYSTGGTIHFIINNQIGFTTAPAFARSSPYPSDVAKMVQAPIFHVNGDDPEAVVFCTKVATEFRQRFNRDVVIDMWCYRRFGHNEADEPAFTQPLMYRRIRNHPSVAELYAERLIAEGLVTREDVRAMAERYVARLEREFEAAKSYVPTRAEWFGGRWSGLHQPADPVTARRGADTGVPVERLRALARVLHEVPEGFAIHPTLKRILDARDQAIASGVGLDWATAEELALASLLTGEPRFAVRLSGQDSGRGTFSQRHAVWVDQETGAKHVPLQRLGGRCEILDSPLSEFGVLGFEYGYALADPHCLVMWEAQFGDFANGAQVMIDQFLASGEAKWLRANGLVLLLPHGYEGQGPEHSSARLERFLQLSAEDNWQVANCTTPANYFHILRRQMLRPFRKPLVLMTPKSLLRHPMARSRLEELGPGTSFHRVLDDPAHPDPDGIRRLILCSGKLFYDLAEARDREGRTDLYLLRIEQLYPFPADVIAQYASRFPHLEAVVWAQEEPRNAGAWFFVAPLIEEALGRRPEYAGRAASAATATGLARRHAAEQAKLVAEALGHSPREVRSAIRATLRGPTGRRAA
ncbi:MAG: 2-oxoglutarate dehydrogenase E1 component [Sphingomonadaceae bacterium]|uniref:2-oxoglutarate dehydrogenase E1 component n=1 Tax=Thermaurantiacus sp. TaxID=2820283 RepID=UPI00298F3332|nr:2-oxoglutarate dehydrogenase E1 component [Thermaurantiacus sp.]MCS6985946.1 2-oxoglutarate dehydrogenase E1 component [Sphingomonadaceae bacterium]MDW8414838.1 2-oxoglutarate dehydrogenase E1 component [Thermaurantiacus sp.]